MLMEGHATNIDIDAGPLSIEHIVAVSYSTPKISIAPHVVTQLRLTRAALTSTLNSQDPHYGINTGFGSFARTRVEHAYLVELQHNLIRSHAAGAGAPLPDHMVRAMMLVLIASLARDRSGVRPELLERLAAMLNNSLTPVVPELGSVGASGDLAPLAHVAEALLGEGRVRRHGREYPGSIVNDELGLFALEPKEGLALINGTHLMCARFALIWHDLTRVVDAALVAGAMSMDASRATDAFLDPRVYEARNHPYPARVARCLKSLLEGSTILPSHVEDDPRVQDPYSIRCFPIVAGAALDQLAHARTTLTNELGAVTDNPLIAMPSNGPDGIPDIISAGNFHGMPIALPMDNAAISVTHLAGISERRTFLMLAARDPETGLRPFMSPVPGLHSGLMIVQYTAAACVNELIGLSAPASVANVPTCAGTEDYNSYGPRSAAKLDRAVELLRIVVSCELLCACQGIDAHRPLQTGRALESVHALIRTYVPTLSHDRSPAPDLNAIDRLIQSGAISAAAKMNPSMLDA